MTTERDSIRDARMVPIADSACVKGLASVRVQYAQSFGDPGMWNEIISELRAADHALHTQSPDRPQLQALLDTALAALPEAHSRHGHGAPPERTSRQKPATAKRTN
jgi:hypothetical protein